MPEPMMNKIAKTQDVAGLELAKGDTVSTLSGDMTAKVYDLCEDVGEAFVRLRPLHRPYTQGVWYPADQVQRLSKGKPRLGKTLPTPPHGNKRNS